MTYGLFMHISYMILDNLSYSESASIKCMMLFKVQTGAESMQRLKNWYFYARQAALRSKNKD